MKGGDPTTVLGITRTVLEKNGHGQCYALEELARALDHARRNVRGKVRFYKWTALALLTLIPILSAFLSIAIADEGAGGSGPLHATLPYVSYLLTFLAILSSIFNPGERFKRICRLGIKIEDIRARTLEKLEVLAEKGAPLHPHALVERVRKELEPYQRQLIDLFLPDVQVKTPDQSQEERLARRAAARAAGR